ncbi:MAG: right-handed parallel beta-helix repeat-containing protein [Verrucomicrobiae bacterium]|nr:right-handed parallel beta-helix repeat-containing protein [Verrucomicrobiae bacterium]
MGADFYCDPLKGSPQGDGSAARPWRTVEEVITSRKIQSLDAQGKTINPGAPVKAGDTLWLRSGWHGTIRIPTGYNKEFITFAAEPGHTPHLGWVDIGGGSRWRVKGLMISPSLAPNPIEKPPHSLVMLGERGQDDSEQLVVEDCFVFSVLDTAKWSAKDWVTKPQSGIWLGRYGRSHVARNNFVLNTRFGINLCAPDVICEGNVVANYSADGIRVTRDGQVVRYNVVKNNFVGAEEGDDNHDDGIQAFLFNVGRGTLRGVRVEGNVIVARERDDLPYPNPLQGIGFFDGPLVQFVVECNVVLVNHWHGITLGDAQQSLVRSNVAFSRWTMEKPRPWIMLGQKQQLARGNTAMDNWAHSFSFKDDPEVIAARNQPVTEAILREKLLALIKEIEAQFGERHPVAGRRRLEMPWLEKGGAASN